MSTFSQGVKEKFAVSPFTLSLNLICTPLKDIIDCAICAFEDILCNIAMCTQTSKITLRVSCLPACQRTQNRTNSVSWFKTDTLSSPPTLLYPNHPYKYNQCHDDTIILLIYKVCIMAAICVGMVVTTHVFYVQHKGKVSISIST